jgi:hypothetical protein
MTRIFVALFDYDPLSMSPNPDAAREELPFKEGQILKVPSGVTATSHGRTRPPSVTRRLVYNPSPHPTPYLTLPLSLRSTA